MPHPAPADGPRSAPSGDHSQPRRRGATARRSPRERRAIRLFRLALPVTLLAGVWTATAWVNGDTMLAAALTAGTAALAAGTVWLFHRAR